MAGNFLSLRFIDFLQSTSSINNHYEKGALFKRNIDDNIYYVFFKEITDSLEKTLEQQIFYSLL
ncbi:hypothetical protein BACSP_01732 [Bacillus sp. T2.9-1]|nr:hypothetical protein BACSP_01732 [Bacillus sp. T2.9-1]